MQQTKHLLSPPSPTSNIIHSLVIGRSVEGLQISGTTKIRVQTLLFFKLKQLIPFLTALIELDTDFMGPVVELLSVLELKMFIF